MTELPPGQAGEAVREGPPSRSPVRKRWQISLRTVFLLVAAVAVWITYFINRRENTALEARIASALPLAHELIVDDPSKFAVVKLEEYWYDENRWDLYLPPGSYRLCLATHKIENGAPAPLEKSTPIQAGRHRVDIEVEKDRDLSRITVSCDGIKVLTAEEPKEWDPGFGSEGGGHFSLSEQLPTDQPMILFRRRFMQPIPGASGSSAVPDGPAEGLLLWIESTSGSMTKP